jgi:hypothetical protein
VKIQEDFRQTPEDTVEKLADYIRTCAAVIHLVGELPGAPANPAAVAAFLAKEPTFLNGHPDLRTALGDLAGVTYTQWEAYLALHYNVSLFIYATDKGDAAQANHLKRLRAARKYPGEKRIAEPADLLGQLIGDLRYIVPALGTAAQRLAPPRFLHHTAELFLGREAELAALDRAWADGTNVLSVIAWGGVGKTALLSEWIQSRFINTGWKDADGRPSPLAYFDWSFYDQGTRATADESATRTGSVGDFFEQALTHFGDTDVTRPGKGKRLAELVRRQRALLVLDGLEPLQQPVGSPTAGRLIDPDLRDLVTALALSNPGLLVLTSRQALTDLDGLHGAASRKADLDDLPRPVAVNLLRKMQITGTEQELREACDKFGCHALSLTLLGRFLFDAHQGDVRRIDRVLDLQIADALTREERHRTAWKVLEAYQEWLAKAKADGNPKTLAVLRLTGLFDRTASAGCLSALRAPPVIPGLTDAIVAMSNDEWTILLRRLERAHLIKLRKEKDEQLAIDAHPLVREYFAKQLRDTQSEAFREAHSRLFDHLCATTPPRPDTLDGLQPLYQAVVHGCLAGRHTEAFKVFVARILRGTKSDGFYSRNTLGAIGADLGAVAAFFDEPWVRVSPNLAEPYRAWLLSEAAFSLRALGRLTEALQPRRAGLEMLVQQQDWKNAAIAASNLSELEVELGRLVEAVADARQSVAHADQSGVRVERAIRRTTVADALHQGGARAEAGALFAEAERMERERQPQYPLLYSMHGFWYCDWLLVPAERAAWHALLGFTGGSAAGSPGGGEDPAASCAEVQRRGTTTLKWMGYQCASLLGIALNHLTLARVGLARALLAGPVPQPALDLPHVAAAVNGLRNAGTIHQLPKGLLTAAVYHFVRGEHDRARALLDEAQQIAERGPMPLHLADVHLHRARLFRDRAELATAAELIRELGYGRRFDELADAEEAAAHWPG